MDGRDVAPVEVALTRRARARGLLGRRGIEGALLLPRTGSVHAVGMRFALDVARCDAELVVRRVDRLAVGGALLPRCGLRHTLEAPEGAFAAWGIGPGARLAIERRR